MKMSKAVNLTASLINRSKLLMLDDSESDPEANEQQQQQRPQRRHKRVGRRANIIHNKLLSRGKRKRKSAAELGQRDEQQPSTSSGKSGEQPNDSMEVEFGKGSSISSSDNDSDICPVESSFDGDDEQSDFCDSSTSTSLTRSRARAQQQHHSRSKIEFKVPSQPCNRFSTIGFDPVPSSSSSSSSSSATTSLWKRRKPTN